MLNKLHFFLSTHLKQKRSYPATKNSGFTLIELLVAMILAVLVITPLLGFMISIMETDRNEQAKANSEQEVQAALNYINQDLQQAIYIYDAKGIKTLWKERNELPYPNATDRVPVLVFWKRQFEKQAIDVKVNNTSQGKNDSFVYSLVAYYLIENNNTNDENKIWSRQFKIARFEVKDGIRDPDKPIKDDGSPNYISKDKEPDKGFALFRLSDTEITGSLEEKMNAWKKKDGQSYTKDALTLIDYVDSSPQNTDDSLKPVDCTTVFDIKNVPAEKKDDKKEALRVPPETSSKYSYSSNTNLNNGSFYACVDIDKNAAQVYIRGNALARIYPDKDKNKYSQNRSSYFPKVNIQVKGRGIIGAE